MRGSPSREILAGSVAQLDPQRATNTPGCGRPPRSQETGGVVEKGARRRQSEALAEAGPVGKRAQILVCVRVLCSGVVTGVQGRL